MRAIVYFFVLFSLYHPSTPPWGVGQIQSDRFVIFPHHRGNFFRSSNFFVSVCLRQIFLYRCVSLLHAERLVLAAVAIDRPFVSCWLVWFSTPCAAPRCYFPCPSWASPNHTAPGLLTLRFRRGSHLLTGALPSPLGPLLATKLDTRMFWEAADSDFF